MYILIFSDKSSQRSYNMNFPSYLYDLVNDRQYINNYNISFLKVFIYLIYYL